MAGFYRICCVVNMGDASKTLRIAGKYGAKGGIITVGRGAVHSRLLDTLGINEVRKEIVSMIVEDEFAADVMKGVGEGMQFHKPNHGIAFSYRVSDFIGSRRSKAGVTDIWEAKNSMYKVIHAIVEKGRGGEVVEAANVAGARGGTIIHVRGSGIHEVHKLFSIEIEPEKDEVFVIAKAELKDGIVASIRDSMELDEPGKGILFVMDIEEVYGIHED